MPGNQAASFKSRTVFVKDLAKKDQSLRAPILMLTKLGMGASLVELSAGLWGSPRAHTLLVPQLVGVPHD